MIIKSPVPAIDKLKISTMKSGRIMDGRTVIIAKHTPVVLTLTNKGNLFCNQDANSYCLETFWWVKGVLQALVSLKVITKDDMETHLAAVKEKHRKIFVESDKQVVRDACRKHGWTVKFPPEKKNK